MKLRLLLFFLQLSAIFNFLAGQVHDFDSLYKEDVRFKESIRFQVDTFDIFSDNDLLKITVTSDFRNLIRNKMEDDFQPATMEFLYNDTIRVSREIRIRPRGNFRRENCYYPPLLINFPGYDIGPKQFKEYNELKFVNVCKGSELDEQYLLSEYYAYRIYNLITPYSFRVRLLQVEFIDAGRKNRSRINYGFVIESEEQMAKRLNAINYYKQNVHSERTNRSMTTVLGIYQYMIGNTDWSIPILHNVKLIKVNEVSLPEPIAVPYDFDYSGIVNAHYAIPSDNLPIEKVTERFFLGFCRELSEFELAFEFFNGKKDEIISMYEGSAYLDTRNKKETVQFLEQFYRVINSADDVQREFIESCR